MMNMAMTAENLKRSSPDDEELSTNGLGFGYKENADSEIWARTVQHWDKHISETPTFWFLDEEIMSKARSQKIEDED